MTSNIKALKLLRFRASARRALLFLTVYTVKNNGLGTQKFSKKYRYVNDVPNSCKETITKVTSQDEEHYIVTPLRASVSEARLDAIYG